MQLMADAGEEFGRHPGLGWIPGVVARLEPPIPQRASRIWAGTTSCRPSPHPLIVPGEAYFLHSFAFHAAPTRSRRRDRPWRPGDRGVARDNLIGVQFHPEKSQAYGLACSSAIPRLAAHEITIYPAIDLKGGKVVRLAEGDMARATIYNDDPVAQANVFAECGADHLHVVDLDGAFAGESVNGDVVAEIVESFPGKVQVGGGIRTRAAIDRWIDSASRAS
jgi:hypothetical protein